MAKTCTAIGDSETLTTATITLVYIASALSMIGTLTVMITYLRYKKIQISFSARLLFWLSITDFFAAASHFIPQEPQSSCTAQGFFQQMFFLSSFLWMFCIGYSQYLIVCNNQRVLWKYKVLYQSICWVLPFLIAVVLLSLEVYGCAGVWCWIETGNELARWVTFYGPMCVVLLSLVIIYVFVVAELYKKAGRGEDLNLHSPENVNNITKHANVVRWELTMYVAVFAVIRIPSIVDRVQDFQAVDNPVVQLLHAFCSPLQGFLNAVLFMRSKSVLRVVFPKPKKDPENVKLLKAQGKLGVSARSLPKGGDDDEKKDAKVGEVDDFVIVDSDDIYKHPQHNRRLMNFPLEVPLKDKLNIAIASWNMGNSPLEDVQKKDLSELLPRDDKCCIYAIGVQECSIDLERWQETVLRYIGAEDFIVCAVKELRDINMIIFVRKSHLQFVRGLNKASVGTGLGNLYGNKGGVGVSFFFDHISLCFVNCHLAAHSPNIEQRKKDVILIHEQLSVLGSNQFVDISNQFHCLFFFGDMNFRIDMDRGEVDELLEKDSLDDLYRSDQLHKLREQYELLYGFQEGKVDFRPTFKFKRDTDIYVQNRIPSWCDRITWKPRLGVQVRQHMYRSVPKTLSSDHQPVYSSFTIAVPRNHYRPSVGHQAEKVSQDSNLLPKSKARMLAQNNISETKWTVIVSDLKCLIGIGPVTVRIQEPYISFNGTLMKHDEQHTASDQISETQETMQMIEWADESVPQLSIKHWTQEGRIELSCVHAVLRDAALFGEMDVIGQGVIELRDTFDERVTFSTALVKDTALVGVLMGTVTVQPKDRLY